MCRGLLVSQVLHRTRDSYHGGGEELMIPVIDVFAGPGGLGEGFVSLGRRDGRQRFKGHLSIEKDPDAHRTLKLRAFFRQFSSLRVPQRYYDVLRPSIIFL